jgi:putative transposase
MRSCAAICSPASALCAAQNAAPKKQRGSVMGWVGWEEVMVGLAALWLLVRWCGVWMKFVHPLVRSLLHWLWRKLWRKLPRCWPFKINKPAGHFYRKAANHEALDTGLDQPAVPNAAAAQVKPFEPYRVNRKPEWVTTKVLWIKAHLRKEGCRKVAQAFNQEHGPTCTVSKSFVAGVLKRHQYALWCLRREIQNKKPTPTAVNAVWAMDLTFYADAQHHQQTALGIIDHGSRLLVRLQTIINKNSWTLLGQLCLAIGRYGKPKAVRTDNERVFTSDLFKLFFMMAGIKHQRIALHSPWQNGRIERLFGTLKPLLKQLVIPGQASLQMALDEFRLFYNHCRTHQNLDGLTPAQVWNKVTWADLGQNPPKEVKLVHAMNGACVGYHIRR